jgi:hypothetical protein
MTVERNLPEEIWKRYLVNEHPALNSPDQIRQEHILQFQTAIPDQHFELLDDGSINYALDLSPVRKSAFSEGISFANAVLGPSHNYEPPRYSFEDGSVLGDREINELRELAEKFTVEINWQDRDVAIIDNNRVMHGRRAIKDTDRKLFIGMGRI